MERQFQILFSSRRPPGFNDEELLDQLIAPAAQRNRAAGIGGCLWSGKEAFVYLAERDRDAVIDLLGRIAQDGRHSDITILHSGFADEANDGTGHQAGFKWIDTRTAPKVPELLEALEGREARDTPLRLRLVDELTAQLREGEGMVYE